MKTYSHQKDLPLCQHQGRVLQRNHKSTGTAYEKAFLLGGGNWKYSKSHEGKSQNHSFVGDCSQRNPNGTGRQRKEQQATRTAEVSQVSLARKPVLLTQQTPAFRPIEPQSRPRRRPPWAGSSSLPGESAPSPFWTLELRRTVPRQATGWKTGVKLELLARQVLQKCYKRNSVCHHFFFKHV